MKDSYIIRFGKMSLVLAAEAGLLWGIILAATAQSRHIDAEVTEISDLKDPSPFRVALLGHLDKIQLSLDAYLRSPDPSLLKQIADSRQDFENSLPEFERQNKRLFPPEASAAIRESYEVMKSSLDQAVEVSSRRSERLASLEANFKQMLDLVERRIRPLLRKDNPDAKERLDSILNVENQLRAWQQNLEQSGLESSGSAKALAFENDSKGQSLLEDHAQLMMGAAEKNAVRNLTGLWKANDDLARQSFALETVQRQAVDRLKADREKLTGKLSELLPAMRPEDLERRKQSEFKDIRYRLIATGALGLAGVVTFAFALLLAYRQWLPPTERRWKSTFEIDMKGTIISWSKAAMDLYGFTPEEMRGQSIALLFSTESEIGRLYKQMQSGDQTAFKTTHKIKGGSTVPVRVQFLRITDKSGNLSSIGLECQRQ